MRVRSVSPFCLSCGMYTMFPSRPYAVRCTRVFSFPSMSTRTTRIAESSGTTTGASEPSTHTVSTSPTMCAPVSLTAIRMS